MSLPAILTASAALEQADPALGLLGFRHAFDEPPETIMQSIPCSVRFPEPADQLHGSRLIGRYNLHNFKIEFHVARGVLHSAVANALPYIEAVQNLYTANLSIKDALGVATCDVSGFRSPAYEGPVEVRYGSGQPITIAIIFYMWAKEILQDITVSL